LKRAVFRGDKEFSPDFINDVIEVDKKIIDIADQDEQGRQKETYF